MPITGRPSNWSDGMPWFFIQLRCMKASREGPPNQCCERSTRLPLSAILSPCLRSCLPARAPGIAGLLRQHLVGIRQEQADRLPRRFRPSLADRDDDAFMQRVGLAPFLIMASGEVKHRAQGGFDEEAERNK